MHGSLRPYAGWRLLSLLLPLLLAACASTTQIETRYQIPAAAPASSILLVARTPEANYRKTWENTCAKVFSSLPIHITKSIDALPDWFDSDTRSLTEWVTQQHIDAVLLVNITGLLLAPPQMPGMSADTSGVAPRAPREDPIGVPEWNFFLGKKSKALPTPALLHQVEAQLLNPDGKMLWNGLLTTHEANDFEAIASSQCKAIKQILIEQHRLKPGA